MSWATAIPMLVWVLPGCNFLRNNLAQNEIEEKDTTTPEILISFAPGMNLYI
jgi:hypothetical protein